MITSRQLPVLDLPTTADEGAGFGVLETERGCLPLTAMDVRTQVSGLWCRTRLEQTFRNASDGPIEATYVFPLPDRAAVHRCVLLVGDRRVEGELRERAAARAAYDGAIAAGHRAAIAEEDRSGVFSLRAGNIPAGETVRVEFEMVGPLEIDEGEATWRFPLVVAPRYVAGRPLDGGSVGQGWGIDTRQVPDASRVTPPVLLPGFPNPVALSLEITLDPAGLEPSAGAWREGMACSLHGVVSEEGPPWTVRLQPGERLDRDFLLRFPVLGPEIVGGVQVAWADDAGSGTLAVTLAPDLPGTSEQTPPRDVVLLLDRSGSMGGWKMVAARRAAGRLIDSLGDADRFAVIAFDSVVEVEQEGLQAATDRNRFQAVRWLGQLEARGGTEMDEPLVRAVGWLADGRSDQEQSEPIIVLVTDGQVAGEDVLLQTLHRVAGGRMPRVFAVGIDQAVNAGFLRRLTDLGQGACELVESEDRLDEVMDRIAERINPPRLKNLTLEVDGVSWDRKSLVPSRLPDLFAGRPVTILGRHSGTDGPIHVRVGGQRGDGSPWKAELVATPGDADVL
ncbi:MAG: VIT domain-containing protein, partial [Planctomycetaceae bacterium]